MRRWPVSRSTPAHFKPTTSPRRRPRSSTSRNHTHRTRDGRGRYIRTRDSAQRDAEACRLRTLGHTYDHIAAELGFADRSKARQAVERGLTAVVAEPAGELRALELSRLDELWRRAWAVLEREHRVVQLGKVVRDQDGQAVVDHGPTLQAIDRLLKIQERRSRLLGLDAPTKVEAITVDQIDSEIARLARELGAVADG